MRTSNPSPADATTAWAADVVAGRILSGELVRYAAERHLRDLRDGPARGLHWVPEHAARALGFLPAVLTITAGAKAGEPFEPLPWHRFAIGSLFGWRKASGRMRFRAGWIETGKGQAKSPLMAAVGLYLMGWAGIPRSEVYAIGQDRATANVLFADAVAMCRAPIPGGDDDTDTLETRGEVVIRGEGDNAWKIEHIETGSKFRALANGEAVSGPRPTAVLADEIHEFKANTAIETWRRAIAKMPGDALMLLGTNTPATTQIVGTDYSEFYQKVVRGEITDDEAFAFIARVDKATVRNSGGGFIQKIAFGTGQVNGTINSTNPLFDLSGAVGSISIVGTTIAPDSNGTSNAGIRDSTTGNLLVSGVNTGGAGGTLGSGIQLQGNAGKKTITGNDLSNAYNPLVWLSTPAGAALNLVIANNTGVDDVQPSIASAATIAAPVNPSFFLGGTATVSVMNGYWSGRVVTIVPTGAWSTATGGSGNGAFCNAKTATALVPITARYLAPFNCWRLD